MSICPFMTKDATDSMSMAPCVVTCELRVAGHCALNILAQKAIADQKRQGSKSDAQQENT